MKRLIFFIGIFLALWCVPSFAQVDATASWGPSPNENDEWQDINPVRYFMYECDNAALENCAAHDAGPNHSFGPFLLFFNTERWFYITAYRYEAVIIDETTIEITTEIAGESPPSNIVHVKTGGPPGNPVDLHFTLPD